MDSILTDLSEPNLVTAIKASLYAYFRYFGRSSHTEFYEHPRFIRWRTQVPHPWFNGVICSQPAAGDEKQTIQDNLSYFRSCKVADFTWWLEPHLQTAAWARLLSPSGLRLDANTPGMAVDLAALPQSVRRPDHLVIRQVGDLETLREWARIFIRGFGILETATMPFYELTASLGLQLPVRHYLGYLNGQPVATSTLLLGAGVAGIYNVATVPEARGRGIGTGSTLTPLLEAREMGYRAGVLQASEMGFRVYQRLGFRKLCQMEHFYFKFEQT